MLTAADLGCLELITDTSRLVGTCYFEFYPGDCVEMPPCWNEGSLYISDMGFSLLEPVFERAVPSFDYNDFNRFTADDLSNLERELSAFLSTIQTATHHSQFLGEYQAESWSGVPLESLAPVLTIAASGIATFCRGARERLGVLWVLGM